jgi:predicted amidohydrolase YtcJ
MTDLLLVNGTIHTQDPARPRARSIACAGGKVESLDETARESASSISGKTVVPGSSTPIHLLVRTEKREVT